MEIRHHGFQALVQSLGAVDAERFMALINRDHFDYTEWRKTQWIDETVASLAIQSRKIRKIDRSSHG
jgi:hypothetical protein